MRPTKRMMEGAVRVLVWAKARFGRLFSDVLVWYDGTREDGEPVAAFALRGDAQRIKRDVLDRELSNQIHRGYGERHHVGWLDLSLQQALEIEPPFQTMTTPTVHVSELVDGIQQILREFIGAPTRVTLMPTEGEPWAPKNDPTPYFSAKTKKVTTQKKPPWVIEVVAHVPGTARPMPRFGADMCEVMPIIETCAAGALVGIPEGRGAVPFIVTHSLDIGHKGTQYQRIDEANAKAVAQCGGLLLPSLAVGVVPASNFGALSLVADLSTVLAGLKPYRKRGEWPVTVYETDTWTAGTREIVSEGSAELFDELSGADVDWISKQDFWVLGAPVRDDKGDTISTTKKLRVAVARRAKHYPREMTKAEMEAVRFRATREHMDAPERYPYLEAKVNGILSLACFPLAICSTMIERRATRWLQTAGFRGDLITVPSPVPVDVLTESALEPADPTWEYAWELRDRIDDYAEKFKLITMVRE